MINSGFMQVRPELQKVIDFRRLNLLDMTWPIHAPLDAIFCRNVMIYFDKETQLSILKKFAPLMRSDGLLFAGHSENFYHANAWFKLRGHTVYEPASKGLTEKMGEKVIVVGSSTGGTEALKDLPVRNAANVRPPSLLPSICLNCLPSRSPSA